jgi:hypothetical protein
MVINIHKGLSNSQEIWELQIVNSIPRDIINLACLPSQLGDNLTLILHLTVHN